MEINKCDINEEMEVTGITNILFLNVSQKELDTKYNKTLLVEDIVKPSRNDEGSAGYDFISPIDETIFPNSKKLIWTGIKCMLPINLVLLLDTRSGNGTKKDIVLANTIGVIDSSYFNNNSNEGHIGVCLKNNGTEPFYIKKGDSICQGVITNYYITDDDKPRNSIRKGGFGSSDTK